MIRRAALIHFREDVTEEQAREALEKIANVLERPYADSTVGDYVEEYDDQYGGPVWYIP